MKEGKTRKAYLAITILLVVAMCCGLIALTAAYRAREDLPVMADGDETESETETEGTASETETEQETETDTETETETEAETEPIDVSSKGLEFTSNGNGTCYVSGVGSCRDSFIIIPHSSPMGDIVNGIGDYAFRGCSYLKAIEINSAIRYVGSYAFYGSGLVNITIPAEVENIGDFAFAGCTALTAITVDPQNQMYRDVDGVLYDRDLTTIITCPIGKSTTVFSISAQVTEIKTMAFYQCNSIKQVNYEGGAAAFRRIRIGAGNEPVESAVITFSSTVTSGSVGENEK